MSPETIKQDLLTAANKLNGAPLKLFLEIYFRKSPEFTLHQLAEEFGYCYGTMLLHWNSLRRSGLIEHISRRRGGIEIIRIGSRQL